MQNFVWIYSSWVQEIHIEVEIRHNFSYFMKHSISSESVNLVLARSLLFANQNCTMLFVYKSLCEFIQLYMFYTLVGHCLIMLHIGWTTCTIIRLSSPISYPTNSFISIWRTFGSCGTLTQCWLQYCQGTHEMDSWTSWALRRCCQPTWWQWKCVLFEDNFYLPWLNIFIMTLVLNYCRSNS